MIYIIYPARLCPGLWGRALWYYRCVRNLPDGSVEAIFEGPKDTLKQAVQWCRKGPAGAYVDGVEEKWSANKKEFDGFDITY
jgi:acylphosphatase